MHELILPNGLIFWDESSLPCQNSWELLGNQMIRELMVVVLDLLVECGFGGLEMKFSNLIVGFS